MKRIFSPDVLAANPDLAAKLKASKAQTPSGRGHGYVDDAEEYERRDGTQVMPQPQLCRINASIARNILSGHVGQLDGVADALLADVLSVLGELIEVLPRREA